MAFTHAVVTFKSDNLPKIVPIKWLVKGNSECYYPNSSVHKRIKKAVKSCSDVHPDWKIFECCVVKYFANYEEAREYIENIKDQGHALAGESSEKACPNSINVGQDTSSAPSTSCAAQHKVILERLDGIENVLQKQSEIMAMILMAVAVNNDKPLDVTKDVPVKCQAVTRTHTSLLDIPEKVFQSKIFPYLSTNELLRVRRTCSQNQTLSENYLRLHPRSQDRVWINLDLETEKSQGVKRGPELSLNTFLAADAACKIRIPTKRFRLTYLSGEYAEALSSPLLAEFLARYGNQVEDLEITRFWLPMEAPELAFYNKLPNLKNLTVFYATEREEKVNEKFNFPATFMKLKKLSLFKTGECLTPFDFFWKLFEFCENLEYFGCPHILTDRPGYYHSLSRMLEKGKHKCLKVLELSKLATDPPFFPSYDILDLIKISLQWKIQLAHVDSRLIQSLESDLLGYFLKNITSIHWIPERVCLKNWVALEYVDSILVENHNMYVLKLPGMYIPSQINTFTFPRFTTATFPNLRKLQIDVDLTQGQGELFSQIWKGLCNLEELSFEKTCCPDDAAFTGKEKGKPAFLKLTKLKILRLGTPLWNHVAGLWPVSTNQNREIFSIPVTDASFIQVFKHMELREFHIYSEGPTRITSSGVRALLSGPFGKTIEKFPFRNWSVADLGKKKFHQLGKEFPNNQVV